MAVPALSPESLPSEDGRLKVFEDTSSECASEAITLHALGVAVESRKKLGRTRKMDGGKRERYLYSFSDGSQHEVDASHPTILEYDRAVMSGTPWFMGLDGYSEGLGEGSVEAHMASVVVSPEVGSFQRSVRQIGKVSLVREAKVQFLVHDDLAALGRFMEKEFVGVDYSRAAVIRQIMGAMAAKYGFDIPYTHSTDASLLSRVRFSDIDIREIAPYATKELCATIRGIAASPKRNLARFARSIPLSPQAVAQDIGTGLALGSGHARNIIAQLPLDSVGNMEFFGGSRLNRVDEYLELYKNHPHMNINVGPGYHLTGTNPYWQRLAINETELVQRELKDNVVPQDIDLKSIDSKVKDLLKR